MRALTDVRLMDGRLLLVTNAANLSPSEVVARYKSLADIERGFRVLESKIEIGPIHHRLPDQIRAHATRCFIALILPRVMRTRLRATNPNCSPERALAELRRMQHHCVSINAAAPLARLSSVTHEQAAILAALDPKKPTLNTQLTPL